MSSKTFKKSFLESKITFKKSFLKNAALALALLSRTFKNSFFPVFAPENQPFR